MAANDFDGYDSVGAGYNWTSYDGESPKGMRAHCRGSFYVPLLGVLGLQLDGVYERNAYGSRDATEHTGTVDIHVFARNQTGLIGVIAQGNYTTSTDGPADTAREHDSRYFIGDDGRTRQGRSVGLSFHVIAHLRELPFLENQPIATETSSVTELDLGQIGRNSGI